MFTTPGPLLCAKCAERLTVTTVGSCLLCGRWFCDQHLITTKGVANCEACAEARRRREETGGVTAAHEARIVDLLTRDLAGTIGPGHEDVIEEAAARHRFFTDDVADYEIRVVDDVQQTLHDTFVDTSWPRCPDHPNHPLWYLDKAWTCEQSGRRIAQLGELTSGGQP